MTEGATAPSAKIPMKVSDLLCLKTRQNHVFLKSGHRCLADGVITYSSWHSENKLFYWYVKGLQNNAASYCLMHKLLKIISTNSGWR